MYILFLDTHTQLVSFGPITVKRNWTWSGIRNGEMSHTVVDVSMTSPDLRKYIGGWRIRNACPISDHRSKDPLDFNPTPLPPKVALYRK